MQKKNYQLFNWEGTPLYATNDKNDMWEYIADSYGDMEAENLRVFVKRTQTRYFGDYFLHRVGNGYRLES